MGPQWLVIILTVVVLATGARAGNLAPGQSLAPPRFNFVENTELVSRISVAYHSTPISAVSSGTVFNASFASEIDRADLSGHPVYSYWFDYDGVSGVPNGFSVSWDISGFAGHQVTIGSFQPGNIVYISPWNVTRSADGDILRLTYASISSPKFDTSSDRLSILTDEPDSGRYFEMDPTGTTVLNFDFGSLVSVPVYIPLPLPEPASLPLLAAASLSLIRRRPKGRQDGPAASTSRLCMRSSGRPAGSSIFK